MIMYFFLNRFFFFFKQKTAYEITEGDWSSDVCSSDLPSYALVGLVMLHMCLIMGDSSALTAGLVTRIDGRIRGAAMAVHSMLGFGAGFLAPLVFGAVLDVAGGNSSPLAWGLAFVSLGAGAIAMAWAIRRRAVRGA